MKKGFTLIELLAVIVILAIIAVIAVPIVLNIINETKQNSNKRSIDMYAKAVENAVARYQLNVGKIPSNYEEVKDYIEYNGSEVVCEDFRIYSDGTTYLNRCSVDDKYINYSKGNAIGKGTLAEAILKQYGGVSSISEIDTEYKEPEWTEQQDIWIAKLNTNGKFGTGYTLDKTTGNFILIGTITEATVEECRNGTKQCGEYFSYGGNYIYKITSFINDDESDTSYRFYLKGMEKTSYNGFSPGKSTGMYKMEDDLGMSYFYRGNTDNNYVKFGKWDDNASEIRGYYSSTSTSSYEIYNTIEQCNSSSRYNYNCSEVLKEEAGKDIYWKIVRINGDGTIRLAYAGNELTESTGGYIESIGINYSVWPFIDEWYEDNLKSKYDNYIANGLFCNNYEELDLSEFENPGTDEYGNTNYIIKYYSSAIRINNQTPTLKCANDESKKIYKVAVINAEEVYVGGNNFDAVEYSDTRYTYNYFHTMTPSAVDNYLKSAGEYDERTYMFMSNSGVDACTSSCPNPNAVSPVINIKADVKFKGDGSRKTPYEIIME